MLLHCGVGEDSSQSLECFCTVVLEKILDSPLDSKEIQLINPKGNQSWTFTGRTDAEAETPIFWPPDAKSRLIWKDPDAGNDWGQEEKGTTEEEMAGWHHWLNGHEFGWTPGVGDGQGVTELNWTDTILVFFFLTYFTLTGTSLLFFTMAVTIYIPAAP